MTIFPVKFYNVSTHIRVNWVLPLCLTLTEISLCCFLFFSKVLKSIRQCFLESLIFVSTQITKTLDKVIPPYILTAICSLAKGKPLNVFFWSVFWSVVLKWGSYMHFALKPENHKGIFWCNRKTSKPECRQ